MNLEYLTKTLIPQREKEIEEGRNLGTRNPIYVVMSQSEQFMSGHNEFSTTTCHNDREQEQGYLWTDDENHEFLLENNEERTLEPVTRFWVDRFVAFFLTSKEAHDYLQYQKHNIHNGYVYVFSSGYRNFEMDSLLENN